MVRESLAQLTNHQFTDVAWAQAKFVPQTVLQKGLSQQGQKLNFMI